MPDLGDVLWREEPAEVGFTMAEVHDRAAQLRARRRWVQGGLAGLVVLALLSLGLVVARPAPQAVVLEGGPGPAPAADPAPTPEEDGSPPAAELLADGLWLSHDTISSAGQPILIAVVSTAAGGVSFGVGGAVQRWEDGRWQDIGGFHQATPTGFDASLMVGGIGLGTGANGIGPIERSTLPPLDPGWYRIEKVANGPTGDALKRATFEVVLAERLMAPVIDPGPAQLRIDPPALAVAEASAGSSITLTRPDGAALDIAQVRWMHEDPSTPGPADQPVGDLGDPAPTARVPIDVDLAPGVWTVALDMAGGGTLVAHLAVIDPAAQRGPAPAPSPIDGELDCGIDGRWDVVSELDGDAHGFPTVEEALDGRLLDVATRDQIHVDGVVGTVVVDGREVVRVTAQQVADGSWVSADASGCSADSELDQPFGVLAGPCPTTGAEAANLADFVVVAGRMMVAIDDPASRSEVGPVIRTTRCRMQDGLWPDGGFRSGDAGQLPPGTPIHQLAEFAATDRVAAVTPDGSRVYQAIPEAD